MRRTIYRLALAAAIAGMAACGLHREQPAASAPSSATAKAASSGASAAASPPSGDRLGPRPIPGPPPAYRPEAPVVLTGPNGSQIWLFERHNLPLVSLSVVVPYGSAADPPKLWGLAYISAQMLTEGAGSLDALAYSQAVHDLGATVRSSADRDETTVSLEVLADKLDRALGLLADAVIRPRLARKDFDRVHTLWANALEARSDEPASVARVVTSLATYGPQHPYGHPPDGVRATAARITLADVARWHRTVFRPDVTKFVVVGDVSRDALTKAINHAFANWKAPPGPALAVPTPLPPPAPATLRTIVVDRPQAPQVVLSVARIGVGASDPTRPSLELVNIALGGSFMSRLNQTLREEHGWTYGARSGFAEQRTTGTFNLRTAIRTDAIAPALGETFRVVDTMVKDGLSSDELARVRAQAQGDVLAAYGTAEHINASLAQNAGLGLGPDDDVRTIDAQLAATQQELDLLAKRYLALDQATVVLVGPREIAEKALADNHLPAPEPWSADGEPLKDQTRAR